MLNSIHTFSIQFIPVFQEKVSDALSDAQKRTAIIALAAIALFAVCYLAIRHYRQRREEESEQKIEEIKNKIKELEEINRKAEKYIEIEKELEEIEKQKKEIERLRNEVQELIEELKKQKESAESPDKKEQKTQIASPGESKMEESKVAPLTVPLTEEEEKKARKLLSHAIELMFSDRTLEGEILLLSGEDRAKRHEELKEAIAAFPIAFINNKVVYVGNEFPCHHTLLTQAIVHIKDGAKRLEIVKMLLDKGADPFMTGTYTGTPSLPRVEAEATGDTELIDLIKAAKHKYSTSTI